MRPCPIHREANCNGKLHGPVDFEVCLAMHHCILADCEGGHHGWSNLCHAARRHFGRRTKLWATFNEINVQTFCSYIYGSFPPAKFFRFGTAGRVFLHMYQAHVAAYEAIKAAPGALLFIGF